MIATTLATAILGLSFLSPSTLTTPTPSAAEAAVDAAPLSEAEAFEIGVEAYHYLYPLVLMDVTRRVVTNVPAGVKAGLGPANMFHHFREYPSAQFREVVRPNFDTLYSTAWLDLSAEPMIVSAPDTKGRYYLLPMLDMWTEVIAVPGKRTSGTGAGHWALVPPGWTGTLPAGVDRIDAPTSQIWIIGRTQTNGPGDYEAVHEVQAGYTIVPLSRWGSVGDDPVFKADPTVDMKTPPMDQVDSMSAATFFSYAAGVMAKNPPHVTDWSMVARLRRVGIEVGKPFDLAKVPPDVRRGLERAPAAGFAQMKAKAPTIARVVNGWQLNTDTMGVYGTSYLKRAIIARIGLGANLPEDAVYPLCVGDSDGKPLTGENSYVLHFERSELPPASAFWSVTMYDAQGFQVANPINRFALGDRDPLTFNPDGSLDLYIQSMRPDKGRESNWLPSPASGTLSVTMRIYGPRSEVLDGRWSPPAIRRAKPS